MSTSEALVAAIQTLPAAPTTGSAAPTAATASCEVAAAKPYPYQLPLGRTALVLIDFQRDFIYEGGFGAALGNDVALLKVRASALRTWRVLRCAVPWLRAVGIWHRNKHVVSPRLRPPTHPPPTPCPCCLQASLPGAQRLLAAARQAGLMVVHTLEAHKPDLSGECARVMSDDVVLLAPQRSCCHAPALSMPQPQPPSAPPRTAPSDRLPSASLPARLAPTPPCPPGADLPPSKQSRGNLPEGLRIGDVGAMGRILVAGEPGNGIVDEVAPVEVGGWVGAWMGGGGGGREGGWVGRRVGGCLDGWQGRK